MKSTRLVEILLLIGSLSLVWDTAIADVYKFVGRNGQVVYTDSPRHRGYKLVIKTPEREIKPVTISLGAGRKLGNGVESEEGSSPMPVRGLNSPSYVPLMLSGQSQKGRSLDMRRMQYANVIERAAYKHGLDPALLHAVIQAESSYNPGAVSNKGAMGMMQLMPGTAARYGVRNPYDPEDNIFGGARYLKDLLGMFRSDVRLAVAAYNAGEHNVMKYGYQVPPFAETRGYVSKVLEFYNSYN